MSKKLKWALILGGVLVAGGVAASVASKSKKDVTEVLAAKVKEQDVVSKVTANGKIQAENRVELSALVQGQIVNLAVREGDKVKKGDFLLQIDQNRAAAEEASTNSALKASLSDRDSARTAVEQARRDWERAVKNFDAKVIPEAEVQRARSALDTAQSAFEGAQNRVDQTRSTLNAYRDTLSKTTIRSPLDGVVTTLRVKAGEVSVIGTMNNPGTQLMTISDMSSVLAVLMVDETDTPTVQVGQKALLSIDAYPGQTFEGVVTEVGNSPILRDDADLVGLTTTSDAINFKAKVKLTAPPAGIRPGFSASADIVTGTRKGVPSVPLAAVIVRDSAKGEKTESGRLKTEEGVYALRSGKAVFVPIKTGLPGELVVEVVEGVKTGEEIITGPFKALRTIKDGSSVEVAKDEKKKALEGQGAGTP